MFCRSCRRFCSTSISNAVETVSLSSKWKYKLDEKVESDLLTEKYKPRQHPGILPSKSITVPDAFMKASKIILEDQNGNQRKQIIERSDNFVQYLKGKKPPMEDHELRTRVSVLKNKVITKLEERKKDHLNDPNIVKSQMNNMLKKTVYNWAPVKYDLIQSLCYLVGRSAAEYSVLIRILSEIKSRDPDWKPKTLFDFGSGVGTVTWAVNTTWPKSFNEYFNVDSSVEMNELAELILKGGRAEKKNPLSGVYYRQFFPSKPVPYDLVVSAYTLMELPSLKSRMEAIANLWRKTTKYLIIVEQGSYAGFKIINEVRDFILGPGNNGHIFSPCPHEMTCPQFISGREVPCNFAVKYYSLPFKDNHSSLKIEKYSYIVLKKDEKSVNDQWPRLINPTLVRHKHSICNLCTSEGKIEQAVFTASKYGKLTYRCAKASDWGDRLPVNLKNRTEYATTIDNIQDNENMDGK